MSNEITAQRDQIAELEAQLAAAESERDRYREANESVQVFQGAMTALEQERDLLHESCRKATGEMCACVLCQRDEACAQVKALTEAIQKHRENQYGTRPIGDPNDRELYAALPPSPAPEADVSAARAESRRRLEQAGALMHPNGRCTCGGEGRCEWCRMTEARAYDYQMPAPEAPPNQTRWAEHGVSSIGTCQFCGYRGPGPKHECKPAPEAPAAKKRCKCGIPGCIWEEPAPEATEKEETKP